MPDPAWSVQYNFAQTPEGNGFTRYIHAPDPTVTLVTGGSPANRRIEVDTSAGGDISFLTSSVPSFNAALGMTAEAVMNVSGPGDVGFEVRYLDFPIGVNIFLTRVLLDLGSGGLFQEATTPSNNSNITWRVTHDGNNIRVYRDGVLVLGPTAPIPLAGAFQQFQFWCEGGSTGVIRGMKYYTAGAVAPG